jgi:calcineurin-like phosphoesterase family protein
MKIVCISDTHTYGQHIAVPDGDVLVHSGDHTFEGTYREVHAALKWIDSLPHAHKVIIAGNHDFYFDERFPTGHLFRHWVIDRKGTVAELLAEFPSITYLQDSSTTIDGVKFYGAPWQPAFYQWAFNFPENDFGVEARMTWAKIPDDTDVLLTHGPPRGILDLVTQHGDDRAGCVELRKRIDELSNLKLHVFGHLHSGYGQAKVLGGPTFVNACINTIEYQPTNAPIVVEL